jgi:hypothetical protein
MELIRLLPLLLHTLTPFLQSTAQSREIQVRIL